MSTTKTVVRCAIAGLVCACLAAPAAAQERRGDDGAVGAQAALPQAKVEPPPKDFATAEEHYDFLLERARGGTKHTMSTIPVWDGLWGSGNNTMPSIFLENGTLANALRPGGASEGRRTDARLRAALPRAPGGDGEVRTAALRPAHELRIRRRPALDLGALHQRVRQHADAVVDDERLHERDAPHLYRRQAREHRSHSTSRPATASASGTATSSSSGRNG